MMNAVLKAILIVAISNISLVIIYSGITVYQAVNQDNNQKVIFNNGTYCTPDKGMPGIRINSQKGIRYEAVSIL